MASGARGWHEFAMAAALPFFTACSLFDLADLNLRACESASDCYVLADLSEDGPFACFACEGGTCVPRPPMGDRARISGFRDEGPLAVRARKLDPETLMLVGKRSVDEFERVQGWVRTEAGGAFESGDVDYGRGTGGASRCLYGPNMPAGDRCKMVEHAAVPVGAHLLGAGRDILRDTAGRIRVGFSTLGAPLNYLVDDIPDEVSLGLRSPAGDARSPAVAALCPRDRCQSALVVWLGSDPACETPCSDVSAVYGFPFGMSEGPRGAVLRLASVDEPLVLRRDVAPVPPSLSTWAVADDSGYLLAVSGSRSVTLQGIGGTGAADGPRLALAIEEATEVALSAGAQSRSGSRQLFLVLVRRGASGDANELVLAVVSVGPDDMDLVAPPTMVAAGEISAGLSVSYSERGFLGAGGWSLAWTSGGRAHAVRASVDAADSLTLGPVGRLPGAASSHFVVPGLVSPFSYGRLVPDGAGVALETMDCD